MSVTRFSSLLALALGLAACDGTPPPPPDPDAGPPDAGPPDAGPPDAGPPLTCTETMRVDGVLDETVTVMLDTSMTETRPRDLGLACGNVEGELLWAPQEVIELHVPGTGQVAVELDTVFDGDTDAEFNTVLQVRESCESVPSGVFPPTCFDDAGPEEFRSRGGFSATGGDTLYILVTGYSEPPAEQGTVDSGRVRLDISVSAATVPTVAEAGVYLVGTDTVITATGNDPGADVRGIALNFYVGGTLLDIFGDGEATEDGSLLPILFEPAPETADYTANAIVTPAENNLTAYLRAVGATQARVRVFDSTYAMSEPLMVDIDPDPTTAGEGEACGGDVVCRPVMSCIEGACAATGAIATACGGAIPLAVPLDGSMPLTHEGTTGGGLGNFAPSTTCVGDPRGPIGAETIYRIDIPAGATADLMATTNLPETGSTDTILYLRSACPDSSSGAELACNDDRGSGDPQSQLEAMDLTEGSYFLFVERYGGLMSGTIPHALEVTLRPVLAAGAPCDSTGVANRCATGACPAGAAPVCPP